MLAASYWSLLAPAIEMAATSGYYGKDGKLAFIPVSAGFILGAVFVFGADKLLPYLVTFSDPMIRTFFLQLLSIGKISLTSPIVINVPTRDLLAVETKGLCS